MHPTFVLLDTQTMVPIDRGINIFRIVSSRLNIEPTSVSIKPANPLSGSGKYNIQYIDSLVNL